MKQPLKFHEEMVSRITAYHESLVRQRDELTSQINNVATAVDVRKRQIAAAKAEGRTEFDEEKYLVKRKT